MSSVCGYTDCGFTAEDAEMFNAHMHGHEQATEDRAQAAASAAREIEDSNAKALEKIASQKLSAQKVASAIAVLSPIISAAQLLLADESARVFIVDAARDLWREINPPVAATEPPKE